ncbi:hypothetical protein D8779_00685 [Pseudomonas leptonychotis]|uniref:Uncharacterized protein n=1 Tax=Pseudomonas leptonychotis TaxID=2448482 RepID=A0A4T2A2E9_9PSED|nr:hypothetical protein D8779_00685 [Pseudomonas leptonychotis]
MKRRRGRQDKAKTGEEAEFTGVNEHSEPVFNAVLPTQVVFNGLLVTTLHTDLRQSPTGCRCALRAGQSGAARR